MTPTLGQLVQSFFADHLVVQKGLRCERRREFHRNWPVWKPSLAMPVTGTTHPWNSPASGKPREESRKKGQKST